MDKDDRSTYGTTTAKPDAKVGVEVGGGEKAAAKEHPEKHEAGSTSERRHEKRPEGPHAKPKNTNYDATPGAGTLPDAGDQDATGG